jgi:hypothetical protein
MEIDEGGDKEDAESDDGHEARADPMPDWRIRYLDYLVQEILPTDKDEARRLVHRAKCYFIIEGVL